MKLRYPRRWLIDWLSNFTMNWLDRSSVKGLLQLQGEATASLDFGSEWPPESRVESQ
jgi:hypothetical protein